MKNSLKLVTVTLSVAIFATLTVIVRADSTQGMAKEEAEQLVQQIEQTGDDAGADAQKGMLEAKAVTTQAVNAVKQDAAQVNAKVQAAVTSVSKQVSATSQQIESQTTQVVHDAAVKLAAATTQPAASTAAGSVTLMDVGNTVDPVSGEQVASGFTAIYNGKIYHFSSAEDVALFEKTPATFAQKLDTDAPTATPAK